MASLPGNRIWQLSEGFRCGTTFVVALGSAGLLGQFTPAPPIFLALIASVAVTAMSFASFARDPFDADYLSPSQIGSYFLSFLTALLGIWGLAALVPASSNFVCEPLVPWQLSIALFGAYGMSWLFTSAKLRTAHDWTGLLIHMAFFWIAPFYGFFHPPWFLAQTIAMPCPDRPLAQAIVVALGMLAAAIAGRQTAKWMTR